MRVLLSSSHQYPADGVVGVGLRPKAMPSGSGGHIHDLLARGLAELGHEVSYLLRQGASEPPPPGVRLVTEPDADAEVYHSALYGDFDDDPCGRWVEARGRAWVTSCHMDRQSRGQPRLPLPPRTIYVSPSLAKTHGSDRFVWNGLDPARYAGVTARRDYLLFVSALEWARDKGLDTAVEVARRVSMPLIVAGTGRTPQTIAEVTGSCRASHVEFVGDVRGAGKARLYAGAHALLFPSRLNEGCPLAIIEALMSGTPVVASAVPACVDMVTPDVGFICRTIDDYVRGVRRAGKVATALCRRHAVERYHYRRMTEDYLREYARALSELPAAVSRGAAAGRSASRA
jgi:glycosyltransferase involved in cell wall biosynthesis